MSLMTEDKTACGSSEVSSRVHAKPEEEILAA
jgi:hypothetical protein